MKFALALALLIACPVVSTSASADILQETYTGVVSSGIDNSGLFGTAGGSLQNQTFTATFLIDTSKGVDNSSTSQYYFRGGSWLGVPSPVIGGTLSINGREVTLAGSFDGEFQISVPPLAVTNFVYTSAQMSSSDYLIFNIANSSPNFPVLSSLDSPFSYSPVPSDTIIGQLAFADDLLNLIPNQVTLSVSAVPEPSTWAMMIFGFAGISAMTFRARKSTLSGAQASTLQN